MLHRQLEKFRASIEKKSCRLAEKPSKKTSSIQQSVGRLRERYPSASKHFDCEVLLNEKDKACGIALNEKPGQLEWTQMTHGAYILSTNTASENPTELWRWYIQLTEAESAFRDLKGDLALRPIYHHLQCRVEAHILVCFLSLCLWRTLEHWMGISGLGDEAGQFLIEMRQIHSMDVCLPHTWIHARQSDHLRGQTLLSERLSVLSCCIQREADWIAARYCCGFCLKKGYHVDAQMPRTRPSALPARAPAAVQRTANCSF